MSDPIERQDAINEALKCSVIEVTPAHMLIDKTEMVTKLLALPSVQPEIIRCKDCKWSDWYTSADSKRYCYCMETGNGGRTENDFCSYAERQEE